MFSKSIRVLGETKSCKGCNLEIVLVETIYAGFDFADKYWVEILTGNRHNISVCT